MGRRAARGSGVKYHFGEFQLDITERALRQFGKIIPLSPKAAQCLELLARNSGRVISRAEMLESVWPEADVEESNLTVNISMLRRKLGTTRTDAVYRDCSQTRLPVCAQGPVTGRARRRLIDFTSMQIIRLTQTGCAGRRHFAGRAFARVCANRSGSVQLMDLGSDSNESDLLSPRQPWFGACASHTIRKISLHHHAVQQHD